MRARLLAFPYPPANFAAQISLPDLPAPENFFLTEYPVSETDRPGTGHRSWPAQAHSAQILYQWYGWPWAGYHISLRIILVYECTANVVYFDGVQLFNTYAINNDRRIKNYGRVTMDKPAFPKKALWIWHWYKHCMFSWLCKRWCVLCNKQPWLHRCVLPWKRLRIR